MLKEKDIHHDWKNIVRIMNTQTIQTIETANRQKNNTTKKTQQSHRTSSENIYRHRTQPYTNTNKKICSVPLNLEPRVSIDIKLDNGQVGLSKYTNKLVRQYTKKNQSI